MYSSVQDVELAAGGEDRLLALSDWANDGRLGSDAEAAVEDAIGEADAWIDSYVSKRYDVPLETVPNLIRDISRNEAVFILRSRRSMATDVDMAMHAERERKLKAIEAGETTLGVLPQPTKSSLVVDNQSDRPCTKAVSRENTKGFW